MTESTTTIDVLTPAQREILRTQGYLHIDQPDGSVKTYRAVECGIRPPFPRRVRQSGIA